MTKAEQEELVDLFIAALQAVVPAVTKEQRALVQVVLDGMLRERAGGGSLPNIQRTEWTAIP